MLCGFDCGGGLVEICVDIDSPHLTRHNAFVNTNLLNVTNGLTSYSSGSTQAFIGESEFGVSGERGGLSICHYFITV